MTNIERRNTAKPDRRGMLYRFGGRRATDNAPRQWIVPRCPDCHHRMNGQGGMCAFGWCRCVCTDAVEKAKKAKENADRPPSGSTTT